MTHEPPPAPDWVLGDDGHWKPPPFSVGRPSPGAPGPSGPSGGGDARRERPATGWRRSRAQTVQASIALVVLLVAGVSRGAAAVDLVRSVVDRPEEEPTVPERRVVTVFVGGVGDSPCPSWRDVTMVVPVEDDFESDDEFALEVNGVELAGTSCRYGAITMAVLESDVFQATMLLESAGPVAVEAGPRPRSVTWSDEAAGTVTILARDEHRQHEVLVTVPDVAAAQVEALIDVLTLPD